MVPYSRIPHFPVSTLKNGLHKSRYGCHGFRVHRPTRTARFVRRCVFGLLNGVEVVVLQGRVHLYDGYGIDKVRL